MFLYVFLCAGDPAPARGARESGVFIFSVCVALNLLPFSHTGARQQAGNACVRACTSARAPFDRLIPSLFGEWQPQPFRSAPFGA